MELKKFYSKSFGNIVADGKSRFLFNGKDTVCTKAEMADGGVVTAHISNVEIERFKNGEELGIFQVNSQVKDIEDMVITINDVTVFEKAE